MAVACAVSNPGTAVNLVERAIVPPQKIVKTQKKKKKAKKFEENQKLAGEEILGHFTKGIRYIDFEAQMQSGKTGAYLYAAISGLYDNTFSNIVILCGESSNSLRKQLHEDKETYIRSFKNTILKDTDGEEQDEICDDLRDRITIIMRTDLNKNDEESREKTDLLENPKENTLIIWDESHFANSANQTIDTFFCETGIKSAFVDNISSLQDKGIFILTSSATKSAERISGIRQSIYWKFVRMVPGDTYKGVEYFLTQGKIKHSFKLDTPEKREQLKEILKENIVKKKYFIIRTRDSNKGYNSLEEVNAIIKELKEEGYDIDTLHVYGTEKDKQKVKDKGNGCKYFEKEPDKFTIALIKGSLRMGDDVHKEHICGVFEHADEAFYDTLLQSLLGRMCGYADNEDITIYLPEKFIKNGIPEFIRNQTAENGAPITNTKDVAKKRRVTEHGTVPHRLSKPEYCEMIEEGKHCRLKNAGGQHLKDFKDIVAKDVLTKLDTMNIPENQKQFIRGKLETRDDDNKGITFSNSHKTTGDVGVIDTIKKLYKTWETQTPFNQTSEDKFMNIFLVNHSDDRFPRFKIGDMIITFYTGEIGPDQSNDYIQTKKMSVFDKEQQAINSPKTTITRGGQTKRFPEDANKNPETLKSFLVECIECSQSAFPSDPWISKLSIEFDNAEETIKSIVKDLKKIAPNIKVVKRRGARTKGTTSNIIKIRWD